MPKTNLLGLVRLAPCPARFPPLSKISPFGALVRRMAHDGQTERTLARSVGPHQRVGFATSQLEVNSAKDFFAADGDVEVFDF